MNIELAKKIIGNILPAILIIVGLYFIISPFFFQSQRSEEPINQSEQQNQTPAPSTGEISDNGLTVANAQEINLSDIDPNMTIDTGHTRDAFIKSKNNAESIIQSGFWKATDYVEGDIPAKVYKVQLGDTLWEIAEAHYGNGSFWTKILESNSSSIGFLPNGSQALIIPGQVLTIP